MVLIAPYRLIQRTQYRGEGARTAYFSRMGNDNGLKGLFVDAFRHFIKLRAVQIQAGAADVLIYGSTVCRVMKTGMEYVSRQAVMQYSVMRTIATGKDVIHMKNRPIQIVVHGPTTKEGREELAKRVAKIHAEVVVSQMKKRVRDPEQRAQLLRQLSRER